MGSGERVSCKRIVPVAMAMTLAMLGALPTQVLASAPITLQVSEGTSIAIALAPDRSQIVFDLQGILFKMPAAGGKAVPITDALFDARQPTWSPDGERLAFQSNRDGHWKIWVIGANGENPHALSSDPFDEREPSWSPDGKSIAFTSTRNGKFDIWARTLADGSLKQLSSGPGGNSRATWSPDGTQIAYLSDRPKAAGIYVSDLNGQERQLAPIKLPMGGPSIAPAGVPTWTPDGKDVLFVKFESAQATLMRGESVFLEGEDFHPFRMQWISEREYLYTADGKIKRRSLDGGAAQVVPFTAPLVVRRADYRRKTQDLTSTAAKPVHGVQRAVLSPDGKQIAFTALGGLWTMDIGGAPRRLTDDGPYAVVDPAWSPDGTRIAFATDRGGSLDIWTLELASGQTVRITKAPGAEMRPAWSPDGKKLVYVDAFGGYTEVVHVYDFASGADQKIEAAGSSPGYPTWMPEGRSLLVSTYVAQSTTQAYLIGGSNQAAIVPLDGGAARPLNLAQGRSIGNRSGDGPVISPDGKTFVYQLDAALWQQSTTQRDGEFDPPRKIADVITTGQSWSADSQQLLVNAGSIMQLFDMKTGRSRAVPLKLTWSRGKNAELITIHAGLLVDGVAETARADVDIVVADGRIRSIQPHGVRPPQGRYIDAAKLTVIPGLMDTHSHLIKEFGATYGRLNLAYGITTVRSPGNVPGDVLEEKEALASGQRPGPNMFVTGYILDGEQTMWEMGTPVTSADQVRRQIQLASDLDYDMIKSYMHTSEPLRAEMVEQAHRVGIPVSGHDIYPAAFMGADSSEHFFVAGSSRGYSAKVSNLQHVYDDVVQILGKSGLTNAPTLSLFTPSAEFIDHDPAIAKARWSLQPVWVRNAPQYSSGDIPGGDVMLANVRASIAKLHAAGARLVVGTDTPLKTTGISTQNELVQMVKAGISPYQTLRAATIVPAEMLGVARDLGTVEPGKIADLVFVEGNPLVDIRDASKVRKVMKSGRLYDIDEITSFPVAAGVTASR
jgi:Tol biopolymer transport system component/imidazolonepropionase-like amidohydrolase